MSARSEGERGAGSEQLAIGGHLWILTPRGRRADGEWRKGGNRHQTISTDHHNVGGSTTVLLEEHRSG